jgi:hypothetical protein
MNKNMPDSPDYRLYLDARFEGIAKLMNAQFTDVHERLDEIRIQTTKTNGRVTSLEDQVMNHPVNCPVVPKVDKIYNDLEEYRLIKKYPKLTVTIISIAVIGVLYGFFKISDSQSKIETNQVGLKQQLDLVNTPVFNERSGKYTLYPSGLVMDSILHKK